MLEKALEKIAEQVIALDEASLTQLRQKYMERVSHFEPTREWEKAVIIYFIINGVITKNFLFNQNLLAQAKGKELSSKDKERGKGHLKVIK